MKKRQGRINWRVLLSNLKEAKEQIESTIEKIEAKKMSEGTLQVDLEHAAHHLYFGWNARKATKLEYKNMSDWNFNAWSKAPKEFWSMSVKIKKANRHKSNKK